MLAGNSNDSLDLDADHFNTFSLNYMVLAFNYYSSEVNKVSSQLVKAIIKDSLIETNDYKVDIVDCIIEPYYYLETAKILIPCYFKLSS